MSQQIKIAELVKRFEENREAYLSGVYNETQLRREFIDPFFKALGWDIDNEGGLAEAYKDVIHEDAIKIGEFSKAPDYCFRVGGTRKFFIEAKKPSVNLKEDIHPAFQLRRYAWSAKLPLSILTDFEEFAVYDCRIKPLKVDNPASARLMYFTYKDYLSRWDEIAGVFSRDAVLKGAFDKYAESVKTKRGTEEVDRAFLKEIESWRELLAKNIAVLNSALSNRELNFVVQRTIDRIIFLRICEDRGIETYGTLQALLNGSNIYKRLFEIFERADERYNSGIFHFHPEKDRPEIPDTISPQVKIDDKVLKEIFKNIYYPESSYEFSVLPVEILGQVYEQFLGQVIHLTESHRARVEEKPEVKKAGGVYYTPAYIVEYIVKNTAGKLLEGKTPRQVAKLKVLDPACGSGSFLIGAYQYLLNWHQDWYVKDGVEKWKKGKAPVLYQRGEGDWRLTVAEKKRILLNNIYGVDIDSQAVEVTKLSLLLKVLEGESGEVISKQYQLFHERVLPDLGNNIKCGNSLIGSDIYSGRQKELWNDEDRLRVNAFDWDKEFPEIITAGGFDAVIGNPPWGSLLKDSEKDYLSRHFVNRRGEAESHLFFVEQSHRLLKYTGMLGFITPNTWLAVLNSREIREYLLKNSVFYEIRELSKYIFADAPDIVPILLFLGKKAIVSTHCIVRRANVIKVDAGNFENVFSTDEVDQSVWLNSQGSAINLRATASTVQVLTKCQKAGVALEQLCEVLYGIKTGDNVKYVSKTRSETHKVKALKTAELGRYRITWKGFFLWWCEKLAGYRTSSLEVPKIIVQYIRKISLQRRLIAALDESGCYYPLNNYSYLIVKVPGYTLSYILGIFNSSLINFYFANTFVDYNIKPTYLKQLPIRAINFSNKAEMATYDQMIQLVEQMLSLNKQLAATKTDHEKTALQRQIDAMDNEIDRLVYSLYGLTEEEIKIVEGLNK